MDYIKLNKMKAKLYKVLNQYHLYNGDKAIATTIVGNPMLLPNLSLKNCQEIANGYDLENMADFYGAKSKGSLDFKLGANQGFEDGFQKALEIIGDKESKLVEFIKNKIDSFEYSVNQNSYIGEGIDGYTQQTEWDVEIVMEDSIALDGHTIIGTEPTLDTHGCLILKRI